MPRRSDEQHESTPRWKWGLGLSLGILSLGLLLQFAGDSGSAQYLEQLEHETLDARFRLRERFRPTRPGGEIVVLTIDDMGIELFEHGQLLAEGAQEEAQGVVDLAWPWPRALYGLVVQYLTAAGARAIFFDFLFTGNSLQQNLIGGDDDAFAQACADAGNVFHTLLFLDPVEAGGARAGAADGPLDPVADVHRRILDGRLARFPEERLRRAAVDVDPGGLVEYRSVQVPLPLLAESARGLGAINATLDPDNVVRRVELLSRFRGATYPSIHLTLAAHLAGDAPIGWQASGPALTLGDTAIPVDERGHMLVNWHGGARTYTTRSLHTVILKALQQFDPARDRELFAGKVVLVGSSAVGLMDLKATPFGAYYPGVEAHATALDNILNADFLRRPAAPWRTLATSLLFLVAGQLFVRRWSAVRIFGVAALLALGYLGLALGLFFFARTWIDLVVPLGGIGLLFAGGQTVQYFTEGRQRRRMRNAFQRYLAPTVVDQVLKLPEGELKLGGDRRELTVYFSDIEGFTAISERLAPEELVGLLNVYLGEMSDIINAHHGTLDKYIGDCVMAFWGAPLPLENGALEACLAALENQERLAELRVRFREQGLPEIRARIGINTGPMLVGNMGSERSFNFTVMGDAVNLASRLEGANKQYGTRIMLGPETVAQAGHALETRQLDLLRVKGRAEPVEVFELLARRGELSDARRGLVEAYSTALQAYRARDWARALKGFQGCLDLDAEDGPSQTYRDRCVHFLERPPSDEWDGVYEMHTK